MPTQNSNMTEEQRINDLEKVILVMGTRLETTEKVLTEIKNVLVETNKRQEEIIAVQSKQMILEKSIIDLRDDFEERKRTTTPFIDEGQSFMNKVKGGILVFLFLFGIIQVLISNELGNIVKAVSETRTHIDKIEQNIERQLENHIRETTRQIPVDSQQ